MRKNKRIQIKLSGQSHAGQSVELITAFNTEPVGEPYAKTNVHEEFKQGKVEFRNITFNDVIEKELKVTDLTAFTMCEQNNMPIYVFDTDTAGNIKTVINGYEIGTLISQ